MGKVFPTRLTDRRVISQQEGARKQNLTAAAIVIANGATTMRNVLVSRRTFGVTISCVVTAAAYASKHAVENAGSTSEDDADATLLSMHGASSDPHKVASLFDEAPTGLLLASYGNFFPKLMRANDPSAVPAALERAAHSIKAPKNPHRLAVLPAISAAHALRFSVDEERQALSQRISRALGSRKREEREILLQNLLTSSLPSPDTQARWRVGDDVVECIANSLDDARAQPQLLGSASMALTFLLNLRATLSHSVNIEERDDGLKIDRIVNRKLANAPPHFMYLQVLKQQHEAEFANYDPHVKTSLPSHLTEMILQSRSARRSTPNFNRCLAIIHSRLAYEVWQTANNVNERDESVMTQGEAAAALPKLVEFQSAADTLSVLPAVSGWDLPASERPFQHFLNDVWLPSIKGFKRSAGVRQLEALAAHPRSLCDCDPQAVADRLGAHRFDLLASALGFAELLGAHVVTGILAHSLVEKAVRDGVGAKEAFDLRVEPVFSPAAVEEISRAVVEADGECMEASSRLEQSIGPAEIRLAEEG